MIYVVAHKDCSIDPALGYKVLGVGEKFEGNRDNINNLNAYLNETTALYDIWKNTDDSIIGMCHYRRFFKYKGRLALMEDAEKILRDYDIITRYDTELPMNHYDYLHKNLPYSELDYILSLFPADFQEWLKESDVFNPCNMFICKKELINKYCEELFQMVLPITEQFVNNHLTASVHHNRLIGFLCEWYFGYWCRRLNRYPMEVYEIL